MDQGFKSIIHDSNILSWLLRSNIDELKGMSIDEVKACLNIGEDGRTVIGKESYYFSPDTGPIYPDSVFDITIPGDDGKITVTVDIEGQNNARPKYPLEKRAEYYVARLVSSQKDREFKGDDYAKIRKVYSIWLIFDPKAGYRNTVARYSMKAESIVGDPNRVLPVMDTFNILMINIGRYDSELPDVMAFPTALFSKMSKDERSEVMMDRFNIEFDDIISKEVDDMASIGEDTYDRGFDDGIEKGIEKGIEDKSIDMIISLITEEGWDLDRAIAFVKVSDDRADHIRNEVLKRLA